MGWEGDRRGKVRVGGREGRARACGGRKQCAWDEMRSDGIARARGGDREQIESWPSNHHQQCATHPKTHSSGAENLKRC